MTNEPILGGGHCRCAEFSTLQTVVLFLLAKMIEASHQVRHLLIVDKAAIRPFGGAIHRRPIGPMAGFGLRPRP
jgi:hypothetical protein